MTTSWILWILRSLSIVWGRIFGVVVGSVWKRTTRSWRRRNLRCCWLSRNIGSRWVRNRFRRPSRSKRNSLIRPRKAQSLLFFSASLMRSGRRLNVVIESTILMRLLRRLLNTWKRSVKRWWFLLTASNSSILSLASTCRWVSFTSSSTSLAGCSTNRTRV